MSSVPPARGSCRSPCPGSKRSSCRARAAPGRFRRSPRAGRHRRRPAGHRRPRARPRVCPDSRPGRRCGTVPGCIAASCPRGSPPLRPCWPRYPCRWSRGRRSSACRASSGRRSCACCSRRELSRPSPRRAAATDTVDPFAAVPDRGLRRKPDRPCRRPCLRARRPAPRARRRRLQPALDPARGSSAPGRHRARRPRACPAGWHQTPAARTGPALWRRACRDPAGGPSLWREPCQSGPTPPRSTRSC